MKEQAEHMGRWAVYLLMETEYWEPAALDKLTAKSLQEFQTRQSQWLMQYGRDYPDSGAEETLRAEITDQVKQQEDSLTEDEAFEMESQRLDGMTIEQLPQRLQAFREQQEKEREEEEQERLRRLYEENEDSWDEDEEM